MAVYAVVMPLEDTKYNSLNLLLIIVKVTLLIFHAYLIIVLYQPVSGCSKCYVSTTIIRVTKQPSSYTTECLLPIIIIIGTAVIYNKLLKDLPQMWYFSLIPVLSRFCSSFVVLLHHDNILGQMCAKYLGGIGHEWRDRGIRKYDNHIIMNKHFAGKRYPDVIIVCPLGRPAEGKDSSHSFSNEYPAALNIAKPTAPLSKSESVLFTIASISNWVISPCQREILSSRWGTGLWEGLTKFFGRAIKQQRKLYHNVSLWVYSILPLSGSLSVLCSYPSLCAWQFK